MIAVNINRKMLTLAREARGLSQLELAGLIGGSQGNVNKWELGNLLVNEDSFNALQKALKFPAGFFLQEGEPAPPAFYRQRDKVAKKLLNAVDANINIYRLNLDKLLNAMSYGTGHIPALPLSKFETPQKSAQELRNKWKIGKGPITNLTGIMEREGILIASINFGTERIDSRSILSCNQFPAVFTNKTLLGDRLRFTLAFELGHLVMHNTSVSTTDEEASHEANLFAAEFLMPEKDILPDFKNTNVTIQLLADLKKKWKVSMQSLLFRANTLNVIDYNQKRYLLTQFNDKKIRKREPIEYDIPIEKPALLQNLISKYRAKQKLSLTGIASFFCLTEEEFLQRYS